MGNVKDPVYTEDFPWIWEEGELSTDWEPQDLVDGSNWIIYYLPYLTRDNYAAFLTAFVRDNDTEFKTGENFELFQYLKEEDDDYELFLIAVQENTFYKFNLKEIREF